MSKKAVRMSIFSVGFHFPGSEAEEIPLDSDRSLLDADIVVFEPSVPRGEYFDSYKGKPWLQGNAAFRAKEALAHWRGEVLAAFDAGKVITVYLSSPDEVYVDTGRREYSGTGRNARVTTIVEPLDSYAAIPMKATAHGATGSGMKLAGPLRYLATYWKDFGSDSRYEAFLEGEFTDILVKTHAGERVVGAAIRKGRGAVILLPALRYDYDAFVRDGAEEAWTKEGIAYGKRLAAALVGIASSLRDEADRTPPPSWTSTTDYRLDEEPVLEAAIAEKTQLITQLQTQRQELQKKLEEAAGLRALIYESGRPLERAVLESLTLMGFTAAAFVGGTSEFDAVFTAPEGRFLGEVEGKESKPIDIEKFAQPERNRISTRTSNATRSPSMRRVCCLAMGSA